MVIWEAINKGTVMRSFVALFLDDMKNVFY